MNLIFLDTETTGFGECRLVEFAYANQATDEQIILTFRVKPPILIEDQAITVHGIRNEDVAELWPFIEHPDYVGVKNWIEKDGSVVVAHNAPFDIAVLKREGINVHTFIDTKKIAMKLYKNAPNHKLQTLREYLHLESGLTAEEAKAHSAGGDVSILKRLFYQMRTDMTALSIAEENQVNQMIVSSGGA